MRDDLHPDDLPERPRRVPDASRPPADREVPLGPSGTAITDSVHAWLDGDATESSARRGPGSQDVEFWKRMDADLARRRRMRTPAGVEARIMAAIPMHTPQLITPWWRRELVVTPVGALLALLSVMALGAGVTALLLR